MKVLVAGGDRVDAGKTTFAVGFAAAEESLAAFKPRAGNDYWFDHDDVRAATDDGRLYGKDVSRLVDAAAPVVAPEARNPIHRLWRPTPGRTGMLGEQGRTFLVDRVSVGAGSGGEDGADSAEWVVNAAAAEADLIPSVVRDSLPLGDAREVDSVAAFNDAMRDLHVPALERTTEAVRAADEALVESYSDIADPLRDVDYDAVAVVDPGRARIYDGDRWGVAREAVAGSDQQGQLEERVGPLTELVDPVSTHRLPALTAEQRADPDAVAAANADAYDALREAAAATAD
ncbi:ATPase [Halobaculum sp. P14]|uniref:ATPase n=1 Tax=Halobaculum sp. P14 TaxID=3421638 RepID=UPI003EBE5A03